MPRADTLEQAAKKRAQQQQQQQCQPIKHTQYHPPAFHVASHQGLVHVGSEQANIPRYVAIDWQSMSLSYIPYHTKHHHTHSRLACTSLSIK